jgi:hypothetical protein
MTQRDETVSELLACELQPGMAVNTHQDVFWEVREVISDGDYVLVECVHGRSFTIAATTSVWVLV